MHAVFVRRIEAAGMSMFIPEEGKRITKLNTVRVPGGVDDAKARKRLVAEQGIDIAGGFGSLAGKIFRIGVMGPLATPDNVELLTKALAECIK